MPHSTDAPAFRRFSHAPLVIFYCAAYLLLARWLIGFKPEQLFLVFLFLICYFASAPSRNIILGFSIFIIYWIIFDFMKAFPNYRYQPVHIESLYRTDKTLFGVMVDGQRLTQNEYWQLHDTPLLTVITGICYLTWVPVPLLFSLYLFFTRRKAFFHFALLFLLVNLIGFIIYYAYPAAPPWYVAQYGFHFYPGTPGNPAGLSRFDNFFHRAIFKSIYAQSSNVFAAMPSLHSAYPLLVFYFGLKNRLGWINGLFAAIMAGIWFSAVYNDHHYVLDILAGIGCAVTGILLFEWMDKKSSHWNAFIQWLLKSTS